MDPTERDMEFQFLCPSRFQSWTYPKLGVNLLEHVRTIEFIYQID